MKGYKTYFKNKRFQETEIKSKRIFSLPLYPELKRKLVYKICKRLKKFLIMSKAKLIDLFYNSKNRSIKWKNYFSIYEKLFEKYGKKITFVEIGVLDGGSLEIWKKYFGKDSRIIGIDNNPECKNLKMKNMK